MGQAPARRVARVAIVGAGSSGLLLALLLQRQGHQVCLFERAPDLRPEGCGILLVRSGVEAIAAAGIPGLLEEILAAGLPVSRFVVRNLRGDLIESSPAERDPGEQPSLLIQRRFILEALAARLDRGGPAELESGFGRGGGPFRRRLLLAGGSARRCRWPPFASGAAAGTPATPQFPG